MMMMRAAAMANMQSEVFEAFKDIGVSDEKALRAAGALARRDDDVGSLKADVALMKWMLGVVMAFEIAIFFKLFLH
jgi:hypothetical protein